LVSGVEELACELIERRGEVRILIRFEAETVLGLPKDYPALTRGEVDVVYRLIGFAPD
jgi:hypothetical protein